MYRGMFIPCNSTPQRGGEAWVEGDEGNVPWIFKARLKPKGQKRLPALSAKPSTPPVHFAFANKLKMGSARPCDKLQLQL